MQLQQHGKIWLILLLLYKFLFLKILELELELISANRAASELVQST